MGDSLVRRSDLGRCKIKGTNGCKSLVGSPRNVDRSCKDEPHGWEEVKGSVNGANVLDSSIALAHYVTTNPWSVLILVRGVCEIRQCIPKKSGDEKQWDHD
jgi:hypothetical protein